MPSSSSKKLEYMAEYQKRPEVSERIRAYQRKYQKSPEFRARRREYEKAWRARQSAEYKAEQSDAGKIRNRHKRWEQQGWTPEQVEEAFRLQDGCCWICKRALDRGPKRGPTSMCADHNHETGKRRGLLCHRCNILEGFFADSELSPSEWVSRLNAYLETFDEPVKEYGFDLKE